MPFTFVHPAIVLPVNYINKKYISLTALIAGSMMPDFEAYLRMSGDKEHSHSTSGILWFSLPLGIFFSFLFHNVVRNPLINHLPPYLQQKFIRYKNFNWSLRFRQHWFVVLFSLFLGIASHFFWDSFTHFGGFFIQDNPSLQNNINLFGTSIEIPYVLQYISTIIGFVVIIYAIVQVPSDKRAKVRKHIAGFWVILFMLAVLFFTIRLLVAPDNKFDDLLIAALSAGMLSLVITALLFKYKFNPAG